MQRINADEKLNTPCRCLPCACRMVVIIVDHNRKEHKAHRRDRTAIYKSSAKSAHLWLSVRGINGTRIFRIQRINADLFLRERRGYYEILRCGGWYTDFSDATDLHRSNSSVFAASHEIVVWWYYRALLRHNNLLRSKSITHIARINLHTINSRW
jgi:hypothetical protein